MLGKFYSYGPTALGQSYPGGTVLVLSRSSFDAKLLTMLLLPRCIAVMFMYISLSVTGYHAAYGRVIVKYSCTTCW